MTALNSLVHKATLSPLLKQATPVVVERALGSWIYGTDGEKYLDFTTGTGVTSTGHCHPRVVEAAREQAGIIIHAQYTTVMHKPLICLLYTSPSPRDGLLSRM